MKTFLKKIIKYSIHRLGYEVELHRLARSENDSGRRLAFIHVPKCGGISIERGLRELIAKPNQPRISRSGALALSMSTYKQTIIGLDEMAAFGDHHARQLSGVLAFHLEKGWKFVSGHVTANRYIIDNYSDGYDFITVLRHPVQRFVSNYIFNKLTNGLSVMPPNNHSCLSDDELITEAEAILNHRRGWQMANVLSMCITGRYPEDEADAKAMQAEFDGNLSRYKVVGFLEHLERFSDQIEVLLGRRPEFGRHNVTDELLTPEKQRIKAVLSGYFSRPEVQETLYRLCRFDIENYERALNRYGR